MKNKRKYWLIGGGVLLGIILISVVFKGGDGKTKVATEKVAKRNITELVSVTGKIQPESEVKISADVSGEIIEMYVKENDSVQKGQLLLRINPELYETTISQLSANLSNAKAALAGSEAQREKAAASFLQAEMNFKRQKKLYEGKVISEQEWDNARIAYEVAKADLNAADKSIQASYYNVQSMAARLDEGRKNLGRTSIYAPTSGIITNMSSEKGERVVGTAQMAGTEILRVSDLNSMEVEVNINENDIVRIKLGDSADIELSDAYPDRVFKGVVSEISNSAKFTAGVSKTDQVSNFVVKVRIIQSSYADLGVGKNQPFKSGMTAKVDIKTTTRGNVIAVPIAAVTTRKPLDFGQKPAPKKDAKTTSSNEKDKGKDKEETGTWVFIYENGTIRSVKVKTGIQDIDYFEVTEGLKEGDEVVISPPMAIAKLLNNGQKVTKVDKDKIFEK